MEINLFYEIWYKMKIKYFLILFLLNICISINCSDEPTKGFGKLKVALFRKTIDFGNLNTDQKKWFKDKVTVENGLYTNAEIACWINNLPGLEFCVKYGATLSDKCFAFALSGRHEQIIYYMLNRGIYFPEIDGVPTLEYFEKLTKSPHLDAESRAQNKIIYDRIKAGAESAGAESAGAGSDIVTVSSTLVRRKPKSS
jgi:hypothetical protein